MARKNATLATFFNIVALCHYGFSEMIAMLILAVAGMWLLITASDLRHLLGSYWNILSRLQLRVPMIACTGLLCLVVLMSREITLQGIAACELLAWGGITILYYRNKRNYKKVGRGPLPIGTWVNPPLEALQPGDRILTSSRVASRLRESVCHAEELMRDTDGTLVVFSARTASGVGLRPAAEDLAKKMQHGHYVVQRSIEPWNEDVLAKALPVAHDLSAENAAYKSRINAQRLGFIERSPIPMPKALKSWLTKMVVVTGFDTSGFVTSRVKSGCWTCIGVCEELRERLGLASDKIGQGLWGRGKGFGYPLKPDLADPRFQLLNTEHQREWLEQNSQRN